MWQIENEYDTLVHLLLIIYIDSQNIKEVCVKLINNYQDSRLVKASDQRMNKVEIMVV